MPTAASSTEPGAPVPLYTVVSHRPPRRSRLAGVVADGPPRGNRRVRVEVAVNQRSAVGFGERFELALPGTEAERAVADGAGNEQHIAR